MYQIQSYFREKQALDKCLFKTNRCIDFLQTRLPLKQFVIYSVMGFFLCTVAMSAADV